jgi:perosamine synthetase
MIPIYDINLTKKSIKNVNNCLKNNWISSRGEFSTKFEKKFSKFLNIKYSTTVSNGTVALHLALLALGIKKNDEIIAPVFTYVAPVNAIKYVGAKPIFVDADIKTWNIDVNKIEACITKKTKAIIAVHLFGFACNISKIKKLCKKYNLFLIEDTAEALGSTYRNKFLGSFGDISTFSFYGNKTLTTGEGGMLSTNKLSIIKRVAFLKNQAMSETKKYFHNTVGYNYRMTNICAAIGCGELTELNKNLIKKKKITKLYQSILKKNNFKFQKELKNSKSSHWLVSMLANSVKHKKEIMKKLSKNNIETRPLFIPMNKLPMYLNKKSYPIAERIYSLGFSVPSYPELSVKDIYCICKVINKV